MFRGIRIGRRSEDEGERPFWISFADLMTALMVLFLVVMVASLVSLARTVDDLQDTRDRRDVLAEKYTAQQKEAQRRQSLQTEFWRDLKVKTRGMGVRIDESRRTIDFGSRARFASGSDVLSRASQDLLLRFAPQLLAVANSKQGKEIVERVVVEGFADRRGTYLYNLNLSSNRSQRVLCTLLEPGGLPTHQKTQVRDLFSVGGFSFNESQRSLAASRRVEIRIDFLERGDRRAPASGQATAFGACPLGS